MITPEELAGKVEKMFFKVVSSHLRGEYIFPLAIPVNKQISGNNYSDLKNDLVPLYQHSKAARKKGYAVDWKERKINGAKQRVPVKIYFESMEDFLFFSNKEEAYQQIVASRDTLLENFPVLETWANNNPETLLVNFNIWADLIKVCHYFLSHPPPHKYYIRELPVAVHSKFVEHNTVTLKKLLDMLLPPDCIRATENDFASRYLS